MATLSSLLGNQLRKTVNVVVAVNENAPDTNPTLKLDFAGEGTVDGSITVDRLSNRTYFGNKRTIQSAANNVLPIEYDPITAERLGVAPWNTSQNEFSKSDDFSNVAWTKNNASISSNVGRSPDGLTSMFRLVENSTTSAHSVSQAFSVTSGSVYTISVYAQAAGRTLQIAPDDAGFGIEAYANFNLATGEVGTTGTATSAKIQKIRDDMYRCSMTVTATATVSSSINFALAETSTSGKMSSYLGNGTAGVNIWGAQAEKKAYVTPFIFTDSGSYRYTDTLSIANTSWLDYDLNTSIKKWKNGEFEFNEVSLYRDLDKWEPTHMDMHLMSEHIYPLALSDLEKEAIAPNHAWMTTVVYSKNLNNLRYYVGGASSVIYVTGSDGERQEIILSADSSSNHVLTVGLPAVVQWPFNKDVININFRDNDMTGTIPDFSANVAIRDFNCGGNSFSGTIPPLNTPTLQDFLCYGNKRISGTIPDLSDATSLIEFRCNDNRLTGWNGGTISATCATIRLEDNLLDQASVDGILAALVAAGRTSAAGTCFLNLGGSGNAAPSLAGVDDKNTLISRGWTVTTN